jgi:hypothetical protein
VRGGDPGRMEDVAISCGAGAQWGPWGRYPCRACASWAGGPRGGVPSGVWIWCKAGALHGLRGREPVRVEQQLHRPMGWGLGRLAVLLVDKWHGEASHD